MVENPNIKNPRGTSSVMAGTEEGRDRREKMANGAVKV